jgi:TonB family protein
MAADDLPAQDEQLLGTLRIIYDSLHMASIRWIAFAMAMSLALFTGHAFASEQSPDSPRGPNATPADDQVFAGYGRVTTGITPPKATKSPDPTYPEVPADTEPHGVVVMLIGVDTRGHVGPVQVVRSSAQVFEKSAVETVKTWRFKPAKKDGKPVPVEITVEMSFAK